MPINDIVGVLVRRVAGRLARRLIAVLFCLAFVLGALYHLTIAAILALESAFGALPARLVIGGAYALAAIVTALALWATRAKLAANRDAALSNSSRELQIAMIVESILLGLALARGVSPRRPRTPPENTPPS